MNLALESGGTQVSWIAKMLGQRTPSKPLSVSAPQLPVGEKLVPPPWLPPDAAAQRLAAFGRKVSQQLIARGIAPRTVGGNFWIVSFDVSEAIWYPAEHGSWAYENGRVRDGWSQGSCLILFATGQLAKGDWFGEVDPVHGRISVTDVSELSSKDHRWSSGNLGRWRSGTGRLHPKAREFFKGSWPLNGKPIPDWAGSSAQLKRMLDDGSPQLPKYF